MANNAPDVAICASDASASTLNGLSNDVEQLTVSSSSAVESRASPPSEVRALLQALQAHSTSLQSKPLLRSSTFDVSSSASGGVTYTLHSWKVLEHAYRKVTSVGVGPLDDMPTLARGLFTVDEEGQEPRIVVRGYDKFFNVGELPWTKPKALAEHTTGPFTVTWKENGCIIFLSALDQETLIVCSKHSTGQREEGVLSHAQVGEAWLDRHLEKRGRTRVELARELWRRGETAVAELCDDSFEEHVLAYAPERSGLYLHGLNANSVEFRTRPIDEVAAFAHEWGFLAPRWRDFSTLAELNAFTSEVAETGAWEGEALEGFVVRTCMPSPEVAAAQRGEERESPSPPYSVGQAWFFKVKFDYPYLMYREWREVTRKMLAEYATWKAGVTASQAEEEANAAAEAASAPPTEAAPAPQDEPQDEAEEVEQPGEGVSKSELKRRRKAQDKADRKAGLKPQKGWKPAFPEAPKARTGTPETRLYIEWVHARLYGKEAEAIEACPELFDGFNEGRGIIAARERFLSWLASEEGQRRLTNLGGATAAPGAASLSPASNLPFTHTLIVPVAVPGCGKTSLALALTHLFSATHKIAHVQSDDVTAKRSGPTFLKNVEEALGTYRVVIADRNNHLLMHRAEVVARVENFEESPPGKAKGKKGKSKSKSSAPEANQTAEAEQPRVRLVALAWQLDTQPLNKLHRLCAERIVARGENHQSLRADMSRSVGTRTHEVALWRFLGDMRSFGSSALGEGEGAADERFDVVVSLEVDASEEDNLRKAATALASILEVATPDDAALGAALDVAHAYKVAIKKDAAGDAAELQKTPRYYGLAVEFDSLALLPPLFQCHSEQMNEAARAFTLLRLGERLIKGPHVTLVHRKELPEETQSEQEGANAVETGKEEAPNAVEEPASDDTAAPPEVASPPSPPTEAQLDAQRRWEHYAALCSPSTSTASRTPPKFTFTLDRLAWNARCMTLGISASSLPELREVQPKEWTPHITLGTVNEEVRPFEAAGVLKAADAGSEAKGEDGEVVKWVKLPDGGITCVGVLQGMYR